MNRQDFMAAVDWPNVAAEMREHRSDLEVRIAQHVAELRAAVRPERRRDKEQLAAWQANIDAIDEVTAARPRVITYPSGWRAFAVDGATLLPAFARRYWAKLPQPGPPRGRLAGRGVRLLDSTAGLRCARGAGGGDC
jgi:hypothetical protein